jgi:hypothetical protein
MRCLLLYLRQFLEVIFVYFLISVLLYFLFKFFDSTIKLLELCRVRVSSLGDRAVCRLTSKDGTDSMREMKNRFRLELFEIKHWVSILFFLFARLFLLFCCSFKTRTTVSSSFGTE